MTRTVAVLGGFARPLLDGRLPDWVEPRYFDDDEELRALAPSAEIGWFDSLKIFRPLHDIVRSSGNLKWLNTLAAGVDPFPLDLLRQQGVAFTNGAGLNAVAVAEYAVLGVLTIAKGYRQVVRAQDRREWLFESPNNQELYGSRALVIGVGGYIADLLRPFGVAVVTVRRNPAPGVLQPHEWRDRLGEFDWVILVVPSTPETAKMIGEAELAAMKPGVGLLNFARGAVLDHDALAAAVRAGRVGGAVLDVTEPEPLPADHPLWALDNVHITMHLSGRSQTSLLDRAIDRFLENLARYRRGEPFVGQVDLSLGY